jgi:hypothetical protein
MKLRKIIFNLAGLLAMAAVLGLFTPVLADAYDTWVAPFNFKLTITDRNPDGKLVKTTKNVNGAVEMYIDNGPDGGPTQDTEGYYMKFIDMNSGWAVGITALEIVNTDIPGSKSLKIMGVGSGQFFQGGNPVGPDRQSGPGWFRQSPLDYRNPDHGGRQSTVRSRVYLERQTKDRLG